MCHIASAQGPIVTALLHCSSLIWDLTVSLVVFILTTEPFSKNAALISH
jgi:hypothetical protein